MLTRTAIGLAAAVLSSAAFAAAKCPKHPKAEWLPAADARARIEQQGYKINKFKVDGECYEIYGRNKDGKKVEIYYDTKTLDVVKSEVEK
jgi:hypothetical protein